MDLCCPYGVQKAYSAAAHLTVLICYPCRIYCAMLPPAMTPKANGAG